MANNARIMVVEDNAFVRMQIVKFLKDEEGSEYEIIEASDGGEALEKMDHTIDMAIVDIRMEPIDGFEFVKHIRGEGNEAPVILVTGDQNPDLLTEANKWGVAAVLMKPVQRDRLTGTVSRALKLSSR
ncbi:MAG: response regulator [Alphaproteobacteria bacterium]